MKTRLLTLGLMTTCAASALAAAALADPPGRVGRISDVEGEVSFQPPQEDFWTDATRNYPVSTGEAFWTGDSGRAELQIGRVQAWLDSETELDVVDLDYGETRLSLAQGSMDVRVWHAPRGGVSISTPAGEVRLDYAGLYRIDVGAPREDGGYPEVEVATFEGAAGAPSPDGLVTVGAGRGVVIDAGYAPQPTDVEYASVDDWARDREARERWNLGNDVLPGVTGAEDLGGYGDFVADPAYGQVWFPRDVPADWAPYRYGHWAFVQPWGWTWVDDQPWGFAPFHYGRWAQVGGRWGWVAGAAVSEPVYAPALVAFVGGAGWNIGLGISGGAMGWVPLAPGEVFRPTYRVSDTYIRQVNVTSVNRTVINTITVNDTTVNTVTINNYRNAPAATVVRADAFAHGAAVQKAAVAVPVQTLASAPPVTTANRPAPTPEARAGVFARPSFAGQPVRSGAAPAMVSTAPPPPRLMAVRAAVTAQPAGVIRPPVIAGARLTPPAPRAAGAPPAFVAPAQIRNPAAQARTPAPAAAVHAALPAAPPVRASAPVPRGPYAAPAPPPAVHAAAPAPSPAPRTPYVAPAGPPPSAGQSAAQAQAAAQAAAQARAEAAQQAQQRAAERQAQAAAQAQAQARAQAAAQAQAQARRNAEAKPVPEKPKPGEDDKKRKPDTPQR